MSEFKYPTDSKNLTSYELILTENCNFRCTYCFDDKFSDRTKCGYDPKMSLDKIDDILDFIEKTRDKNATPRVTFFGGEPTLNWGFIEEFYKKAEERFDFKISSSINTNGANLNKERIDFLLSKRCGIGLSLDGIQKSHDINRKNINGDGTWEDILKILPYLVTKGKAKGVAPAFLMVVGEDTVDYLYESYKFLDSLDSQPVQLLFNTNYDENGDFLKKLDDTFNRLFIQDGVRPTSKMLDIMNLYKNPNIIRPNFCYNPDRNVTISPQGKLFFCHRLTPKMYDMDENFTEYYGTLSDGYTNMDYFNKMNDRITLNPDKYKNFKCNSCQAVKWCRGGCIAEHLFEKNNINFLYNKLCNINLLQDKYTKLLLGE